MTRKVTSARIAPRKINVPTNSCEIAAACGDAGARVNALAVYGPGIATPTIGGAQDTPCTPHAKCRLARAKPILWVRHIASNISLEDREGSRLHPRLGARNARPDRAYCFFSQWRCCRSSETKCSEDCTLRESK